VRRTGLLASVLVLLMALGSMVTSAATVEERFRAPISGDGLSGHVGAIIPTDGPWYLNWSLEGLKPGRALIIRVTGGTCRDPGALVTRHREPAGGPTSSKEVRLPQRSRYAFIHEYWIGGSVAVRVSSGHRSDCTRFHRLPHRSPW
jgi:hypothetical protein